MDQKMLVNIISITVVLVIVVYYLRKEKRKEDKYFNKPVKLTKKEKQILAEAKAKYKHVEPDPRLPTLKKDGWELEDLTKTATEIIFDQPLPSEENKAMLSIGDLVKLRFVDEEGDVERMWVEVNHIDGAMIQGILRNDSFDLKELVEGKQIWFHRNHIQEIERPDPSGRVD
jgi:hypothetical protein